MSYLHEKHGSENNYYDTGMQQLFGVSVSYIVQKLVMLLDVRMRLVLHTVAV